ncbi:glycerol-3-phosphate 1-O-acyltransferase PlsY [Pandoraea sp.]|uniref:glycerol-3-phosphate 1-O-acyltransferase PlsY n=1 Tax=Pandoraea sp. TaxID=1883445 RepID=UPI00120D5827|nr:glycerol-3-phosphate 1-O-acyltransferase PlsY [Pandoraea sp.]TAL56570.1 MAG: glycerol-3-phosphate 1-O-acyltransferase PlsY [Pandoraea sp.]TAM15391.1 MAG: glycerol-3-phosphate 1-O-acyltransferase PlsY [Pandoraea sp.]
MATLIFVLFAYLIGSVPFAVIVSRGMGLADPRTYGSKNPGATNVLRSGNKAAAALTLVGDAFKGWLAVFLATRYANAWGVSDGGLALVAVAVFVGHLYPIFLRFAGGKGVATAAGVLLAINAWLGCATIATWLIILAFFRYSSLAALVAAIFAPLYYIFMFGVGPYTPAVIAMSLLLIYRHWANIGRLLAGKESRVGQKKS